MRRRVSAPGWSPGLFIVFFPACCRSIGLLNMSFQDDQLDPRLPSPCCRTTSTLDNSGHLHRPEPGNNGLTKQSRRSHTVVIQHGLSVGGGLLPACLRPFPFP